MTTTAEKPRTRAIVVEDVLPHAPETIWKALTRAELIARWLMPNDFVPEPGKVFHFQAQPMGEWNGMVECRILEIDEPRRLVYSWKGGSADNGAYGAVLDSVLSWELTPVEGGTRVRMVHDGFASPRNDFAFEAMGRGWGNVLRSIDRIAATL